MNKTNCLVTLLAIGLLAGCGKSRANVDTVTPKNGETVATQMVQVTFDRNMDTATINSETFTVTGTESGEVTGLVVYDADTRTATFAILASLKVGETITVALNSSIKSASGKELDSFRSTFVVAASESTPDPDPTPTPDPNPTPTPGDFVLQGMTPGIESTDAPRLTAVALHFTETVNPFSVVADAVRVEGDRSGARTVTFDNLFGGTGDVRTLVDRSFLPGERITIASQQLNSIDSIEADPALLAFTVQNSPSEWPAAPLVSGSHDPGTATLLFLDVDQDGRDEWGVLEADGSLFFQELDATSPEAARAFAVGEAVRDVATGDFDGDGFMDIAALNASGSRVLLLRGADGDGWLQLPQTLDLGTYRAAALNSGHFDGDGYRDLFLAPVTVADGARLLWGDSAAPLTEQTALDTIMAAAPGVGADLDGDDLVDLACPLTDGTIQILFGDNSRDFATGMNVTLNVNAQQVMLASLNGDDLADLVCSGATGAALLSPNGDGTFTETALPAGAQAAGTAIVDFDGDGHLDLLAPVNGVAAVDLFAGLGDGTFDSPSRLVTDEPVTRVSLGDVDGDGALDAGLILTDRTWQVGSDTPPPPPAASDLVFVSDMTAAAGDTGVSFEVLSNTTVAAEGYTVVIQFDPAVVQIDDFGIAGSDAEAAGAEFEIPQVNNTEGFAILAAIMDFLPPYDGQTLPAMAGQSLVVGNLTVAATAAAGDYSIAAANGVGSPPADNSFVVAGQSLLPALGSGTLTIPGATVTPTPPPVTENTFVRGDANYDGSVDVSDVTKISLYLFEGGSPPPCFDAADANDDGAVNISDSSYLYSYLFSGGTAPLAPFPSAGTDTTGDALGCDG